MSSAFHYSTTYRLDKNHFRETFEESNTTQASLSAYAKSIVLILLGFLILWFTDILPYAAWFIIVLGIVDALSIYFRKPWWLARQMISSEANMEVTLTINEIGLSSQSHSLNSEIAWTDVSEIIKTRRGWILIHSAGPTYLSAKNLSADATKFIDWQLSQKSDS